MARALTLLLFVGLGLAVVLISGRGSSAGVSVQAPAGTLVFTAGTNRLTAIDVASGRRTVLKVPSVAACGPQMHVTGGHVIFAAVEDERTVVFSAPVALDQPPRRLGTAHAFVPSATEGRVWLAGVSCTRNAMAGVREVTVDGRVTQESRRHVPASWLAAAAPGGLVLQRSRELAVWDPGTGRSGRPLALQAVAASGGAAARGLRRRSALQRPQRRRRDQRAPRGRATSPRSRPRAGRTLLARPQAARRTRPLGTALERRAGRHAQRQDRTRPRDAQPRVPAAQLGGFERLAVRRPGAPPARLPARATAGDRAAVPRTATRDRLRRRLKLGSGFMGEERSKSGRPVYRHEQAAPLERSDGDADLIAAVGDHVTEHFGEPARTWHEIVSAYVHVDVHVVEPTDDRPVYTLVTSGMAEKPMAGPEGDAYAELMIVLPPTSPGVEDAAFQTPAGHWPYTLLRDLARLPHEFETWLWSGHTVPNGDPAEPYAPNTELCGALIAPPVIAPDGAEKLVAGDREIQLFAVYPLHADEMQLKLDKGADALYDLFDAAALTEILDADRPSLVPRRRKLFGRR